MIRILARALRSVPFAVLLGGCAAAAVPLFVTGVGSAAYVVNDRRSPDTMVADQRIQKVSTSRMNDELKSDIRVDSISYNRSVLLLGEARSDQVKERAGQITAGVEGVKQVYNELSVTDKLGFGAVASDASLSALVKARLVGDTPLNVHVTTQEGVVYLMGLVTHREADQASRIAASTRGVKRVVRMFEYIPATAAETKLEAQSAGTGQDSKASQ